MSAFLQGIGSAVAGTFASARLSMTLPQSLDLTGAVAVWELLDQQGRVWTGGSPTELLSENSQVAVGQKTLSAEAEIAIPSNLEASTAGTTYQLRWSITPASGQTLFAFENFTVLPSFVQSLGASDNIEMLGDAAIVQIRLPRAYANVEYECYRGNTRLFVPRSVTSEAAADAEGFVYQGAVAVHEYQRASLDPYNIIWSYWDGNSSKQRESTQLFVATPIILDAIKDMQSWLNRAYTDSGIGSGNTFQPVDYVKYLRLGRDAFNAAVKPTDFSMIAAAGPIRWFWITYACAAACRAQYLAEGMKAFNYAGQTVQLDVDRTPFWESMATAMEAQLAETVKPFKDNLWKRGNLGGDGSNALSLGRGAVGSIGIAIHGLSPMRGLYGTQTPFGPAIR